MRQVVPRLSGAEQRSRSAQVGLQFLRAYFIYEHVFSLRDLPSYTAGNGA